MLSDLYPEAKLSKVFIAPIFEQVVQVDPWYTVEKAIHLDKDMLTMSRNFRLSNAENLVVENAQTETSTSSTRIIYQRPARLRFTLQRRRPSPRLRFRC